MSKVIKQMEMDALKKNFKGVRDVVLLSVKGLNSIGESNLRSTLRKKKIRMQQVKNTLTRKVFGEMGFAVPADSPYWSGPTVVAWGGASIAELSRNLEAELLKGKTAAQYKDKVTIKGAIADGQVVPFDQALKMPTREEAIGQIIGMILGAGSAIAGCLIGPAGQVASQIESKTKGEEAPAAEAPAAETAAAPAS
jgi:large subunit ribosomal protein L10